MATMVRANGEVLKSLWVVCEPHYSGILHSVPSGKAVAAGMVETMSNQPWGSESCAELDLGDIEVVHHHVVAGAEFGVVGEHVIELVPVQRRRGTESKYSCFYRIVNLNSEIPKLFDVGVR
jgi:hypothetical protein